MERDLNGADHMVIDSLDIDSSKSPLQDVDIINTDSEFENGELKPRADDHEAMKKFVFPDDPSIEVETEVVYTWQITNWRKMEKKVHSPVFECGGAPWRVLFFPYGNNCECASFYLEHGFEGQKPPEDWYKCVQFALVLSNPNDPVMHVHHQAHHRFTADEGDWGFTRFIDLRDLVTPDPKRGRPLLENEAATLTAYVRVIKDPTGVLWHNFVNYDSKKETGYVGLKNQGATCYLNSLLQSLYFTNSFRRAVYKIPTEDEDTSNSALALQRLFYLLQSSKDAVGTTELTKSFGWETQDIFAQQDVQELNRVLMDNLETKMKGTEVENLLTKLFVGKTKTYIKCVNVDYKSERIEDFWDIQLNVRGFKNLDESFRDYVAVETMDGENKYFAEGYGLQDAKKGVYFESFPEVLHLHLKRFEYDLNTYAMQKVNDHYEFPEEFDAGPYLGPDADRTVSSEYVLHGVLVHSGDLNAGHYYAFLRPEKGGQFFKFDDDRVTRATLRETMDDNFGGDYTDVSRFPKTANPVKRSMNAYMLVYLRKTKVEEILIPVVEDDIPAHLRQRLEEERAIKEQRRKEREEQHLYLNVRAVSTPQFKAHQGFDLGPFEEREGLPVESNPFAFRFKKAAPLRELVADFADRLRVAPELIRLWAMVNRQNKTVRPDQPLQDLDITVEEAASKHSVKSDLRLWVELIQDEAQAALVKEPASPWIVIFLKYFDPWDHTLFGAGHVYMKKTDKVAELFPAINKIMGWASNTELKLYEEIKPTMIEPMKPKQSFHQAEIQDGDIVCFQKALSDKEIIELEHKKHCTDVKAFYEYLVNLITLRFVPKPTAHQNGSRETPVPELELQLSKKMSYDELAEVVGQNLKVPPTHLRFTTINANTGAARMAVKRQPNLTLANMLTTQYYTAQAISNQALYYDILDIPLSELETKKTLKLTWLNEGISKEELVEALVPKVGELADVIPTLQKKFKISDEDAGRIRFFQAHQGKINKELAHTFNVAGIQQDYMTLYGELVPLEEVEADNTTKIIEAFHYSKEPSKVHNHGVPFKFVVKKDEIFKDTLKRLQTRTGIKGKLFEKIKFAVVRKASFSKPIYLTDDDILYDIAADLDDLLGLDHADKNGGRSAWSRIGGPEIRIK